MIITIDGPAGSGKSTAAKELAKALGIACLDTGATYRAVTLKAMREGVDLKDAAALAAVARAADIREQYRDGKIRVLLDGQNVSKEIRSNEVSENAHYAARVDEVREILVELQRRIGAELGSFVSEGRDQGSVVFPKADVKFFLDADPQVRARRRHDELSAAGEDVPYEEILHGVLKRDKRDRERANGPLLCPPGAISVDTSGKSVAAVNRKLVSIVRKRMKPRGGSR